MKNEKWKMGKSEFRKNNAKLMLYLWKLMFTHKVETYNNTLIP